MPVRLDGLLVIAVSSRALFDFEEENAVFERDGEEAYRELQLRLLNTPAKPGVAFSLVRKLLRFNCTSRQRVEVVILSRNDPVSGLRVFRSAAAAGLSLKRGVFTQGRPPFPYLDPLRCTLFLSASDADVKAALAAGFPAAHVYPQSLQAAAAFPDELRIAFDGDAVLFSDEAEALFQLEGLERFEEHERARALEPLGSGPLKPVLEALHALQSAAGDDAPMRVRTALVTSRSAPAHERAIRTLMNWGVEVNEAMFLGGLEKGPFLREFQPDFFFDDQVGHIESAARVGPAGHVIAGVSNRG